MTGLGHKRRFQRASALSALPPFATKSVRAHRAPLRASNGNGRSSCGAV